jgi:hypothetical protein
MIIVRHIVLQKALQMPLAEDQKVVQALLTDAA